MENLVDLGSRTAKDGFANEKGIKKKFENWKTDKEARKWLQIMNHNLHEIKDVKVVLLSNKYKPDIQVRLMVKTPTLLDIQNISIKKANHNANYNQVDKRWVKNYERMWKIPHEIVKTLKIFTGEISPFELLARGKIIKKKHENLRDKRRFFLDEMKQDKVKKLLKFFHENKTRMITDMIKGSGEFSADWMLVTKHDRSKNKIHWTLKDIDYVINFFGEGNVMTTSRRNLKIGKITMQRKGGDAGRETAKMLQFKMGPCDLFE